MFRNLKVQRAIASCLIVTLTSTSVLPATAMPQTLPAAPAASLPAGWLPLTPAETPGNGRKGLLQLDTHGVAGAKAQGQVNSRVGAAAPTGDAHVQALWVLEQTSRAHGQSATSAAAQAQVNTLRSQFRAVVKAEAEAKAGFAATEAQLRAAKLPAEILQRHQAMVAEFANRNAELHSAMGGLDDAAVGKGSPAAALQRLGQLFESYPSQVVNKARQANKLPWGQRKGKPNAVALNERQLERLFPRSITLAAQGSLSGIALPDAILGAAVLPGDTAETPDTALTPEIRALAAKLSNNPVQIYNWVRNNVQYKVGYGAMQGAAATLHSLRGNDVDTASLLIALYRAANIPARYNYGTIEVRAGRLQQWLGVNNSAAAQTLLSAAGIPNKAIVQGGQIIAVQLEHVWVKAHVDFAPSRGAVNRTAASWVQLDPSFKLGQDKAGLDMRNAVSLNEAGVFDGFKIGALCTIDAAQGVNVGNLQTAYTDYATRLGNFLSQQGSDLTVGDVLGGVATIPEQHGILLGTLPYQTVVAGVDVNALPDVLRWQFRFQLFADATAKGQGQATVALDGSLAALAGKRITLSFAPATQADADTLAAFMPKAHADGSPVLASEFPPSVPGYLIRVKAELRADGDIVASGGNFVLGSALEGEIGMFEPAYGTWSNTDIAPRAGDYHALAIDAQGVSAAQLDAVKARLAATQAALLTRPGTLTRDDVSGDALYQAALAYFAAVDSNSAIFQRASGVLAQRLPSFGRAVAPVKPHMALGIINQVSFPGALLAIDRLDSAVASNTGGLGALAFMRQDNERNSAYAHLVLASMFSNAQQPATAVSAVKVLAAAATQGMQVFSVTAANLAAVLPKLDVSAAASTRLQDYVAAGYRVLMPQGLVSVGDWSGYAMQIEDGVTGGGAFVLVEELGDTNAGIYPAQGMGWLALAQPFQSGAAITPALQAGQKMDAVLASAMHAPTTRWSYFAGQADVGNGLFLARIAAAQGAQACDILSGIVAANLGTASGFDQPGGVVSAPVITSVPESAATAAQAYAYAASATDPQGLPLAWSLSEAPGGMAVGANGAISWAAPVEGSYFVTVRADNGRAYAEQRYLLTVGKEGLALDISLSVAPAIVGQGESVTITVLTNGGSGDIARALAIDGVAVALNPAGQAVVTGSVMGAHQILATATDRSGTHSKTGFYSVRNPADVTLPKAEINAPVADAEITAPVNVVGTASDDNLAYYQLLLRPAGSQEWQEIARGTQSVANGVLGKLDPTQLMNGIYELALNVVDANGQKGQSIVTLDIYRDLKIGQFSISFEDLNVDASGIPIRVTRTYDTRRKGERLDFGHGWSVDYQNLQVRKNIVTGSNWAVVTRASQFTICLLPTASHKINITLPTGKVERFTAANAQECATAQVPAPDVRFNPLPGTTSRLEAVNVPMLEVHGSELYDMENFEPWNPHEFKLTTEENYVYYLTEGIGITRIVDPSGNTLTYSANGIIHSNGQSVAFARDASNRITSITDPAGQKISYSYLATGDLAGVTDRTGAVSRFTYNRSHGLLDYTDPLGTVTARYTYDADGRLIAVTDATGKAVEMTHDLAGNKETVKDRNGNSTTYTYDSAGNVTEVVDALKHSTTFQYDVLGNETSVTNALKQVTLKSFDPLSGKQLTEEDPLHNTTSWSYDTATKSQLQQSVDARKNATNYVYFEQGQRIVEPLGRSTNIHNDLAGNMDSLNVAGQRTAYAYDSKGNKTSETDAAGNVTTFAYDANGREISRSWTRLVNGQPTAVSVTRKLDAEGRALEETDALGFTTKTTYNPGGQVTSTLDPQGRLTTYEYDSRNKLTKTVYADGSFAAVTYDPNGNQASTTDRQGRVTQYQYDALNRLTLTTYPDGSTQGTTYDAVGRVESTIDANKKATVNTYDEAGRLIRVTSPDNKVTRFDYDPNGNRTDVWDANGKRTQFEYDALNRLTVTTRPDGKAATIVWNVNGTKQTETDFAGNTTAYGYDVMGRLNKVTETNSATAQVTSYGYDLLGNKTSQQDAEGRITRWEYDAANRVTSRTLPGMQKETFNYDAVGNLISKVDFAGANTVYGYDKQYQPNLKALADGSVITTTYTQSGQIATVHVKPGANSGLQAGTTSYAYDAQDRLTRQSNPDGSYLAYGYDANGNISERSTSAGTVSYGYDDNQRLATVVDMAGKATSYTYDAAGRLESTALPNGVVAGYRYDDNGRLLQLLHTKGGTIVTGVRYTLADNGQRTKVEEYDKASLLDASGPGNPVIIRAYRYDAVGRLTQEQVTERGGVVIRTMDYGYDKVGNRSTRSQTTAAGTDTTAYTYDSNDRLMQELKTTVTNSQVLTAYTWDVNGNLATKTVGGAVTVYLWNTENRLIEVKEGTTLGNAATVAKYSYDAAGNRVQKSEPVAGQADKVSSYLVDGTFAYAQTVQETKRQGTASELTSYVFGASLIELVRAGVAKFYHVDGLGSVKSLTDADGADADNYRYDAFGAEEYHSGTTSNAYRYTGEYFDDTTGLQYNRARWYDVGVGRFVSSDEWNGAPSQPITLNKYSYANDDPTNVTDPSGHFGLGSVGAASAISGILTTISLASTAYSVYEFASGERELTPRELGIAALMLFSGPAAGKLIQILVRKSVGKTLLAAISAGALPQILVKGGRVRAADLKRMVPSGTPNTFKPSATIKSGEKYQFEIDGVKMEVKWHAPDTVAATKFPGSNSGTMWTAQIKADGKLVGLDGKMYSKPNNFTHIPIDL